MRFSNVRLLVKDFAKCFKFYTEQLGLEPAWGDENSGYASFKVADGIEGLALFVSDWMAPSAGNADKQQPVGMREKLMISFSVDNVDETFVALKAKGVTFISEPTDMPDWGMRTLYLRDPEENLIELFTPLAPEKFSQELIEEDQKFEKQRVHPSEPENDIEWSCPKRERLLSFCSVILSLPKNQLFILVKEEILLRVLNDRLIVFIFFSDSFIH